MNLEVDEHSISTNRSTPLVNKSLGGNLQRPSLGTRTPNLRTDQVSNQVNCHSYYIIISDSNFRFLKNDCWDKAEKSIAALIRLSICDTVFLTPSECRGFVWITYVLSKLFLKLFLPNSTIHSEFLIPP